MERQRHPESLSAVSTCFSLSQYNQSLNHLIDYLSSRNQVAEVPLITCLLFICLAYIQGDTERALAHISSGINMMQFWRKMNFCKSTPIMKELINPHESVEQYLLRTFAWLFNFPSILQSPSEMCQSVKKDFVHDPNIYSLAPRPIKSVYDARVSLSDSLERSFQFTSSVLSRKYSFELLPEDEAEQTRIKSLINSCYLCLQMCVQQNYSVMNTKEQEAVTLVHIYFNISWICIRTALIVDQSAYDQYIVKFTAIVDMCETLISFSVPFSFNTGYIYALYFVAIKCRDRRLRRRAVVLLYRASPGREILLTAEQAYRVAVRVIQLEEAGMDSSITKLPTESSRIHFVDISRDQSVQQGSVGSATQVSVTFCSKPDGLKGEWVRRTEYMVSRFLLTSSLYLPLCRTSRLGLFIHLNTTCALPIMRHLG